MYPDSTPPHLTPLHPTPLYPTLPYSTPLYLADQAFTVYHKFTATKPYKTTHPLNRHLTQHSTATIECILYTWTLQRHWNTPAYTCTPHHTHRSRYAWPGKTALPNMVHYSIGTFPTDLHFLAPRMSPPLFGASSAFKLPDSHILYIADSVPV